MKKISKRIKAAVISSVMTMSFLTASPDVFDAVTDDTMSVNAASLTLDDMPSEYDYAADWIWNNRISAEDSTGSKGKRYNVLFDQIVAGKGTLNYVVRWQSYKTLSLAQREGLEKVVEDGVNNWTDYLVGYENWPYEHVDVNIVGWAVLDKNCILDPQPDEIIYDNLITDYDSTYDTSNGVEEIPDKLPSAPEELWSFNYFNDRTHEYPGTRFDMYLWCTQGFPNIGGCGGDWGQRLSDNAYLAMADSQSNLHVHVHEVGHGFGMTDFYGGEGESNGFPPGGFPGNGSSIMMAGSSTEITDFDGWMLRYMWSKISAEEGRFDLANAQPETTESTTEELVDAEPYGDIRVDNMPAKLEYELGEELDLTGLRVSLFYFPGGTIPSSQLDEYSIIFDNVNPLDYSDDFIVDTSDYDKTKAGKYEIKIKCTDATAEKYWANEVTFGVTVNEFGNHDHNIIKQISFSDTITAKTENSVTFAENGTFTFEGDYYGSDQQKNLANYDIGDKLEISMSVYADNLIYTVDSITLLENSRTVTGDVNRDGTFSVSDATAFHMWLTGAEIETDTNLLAGDMNNDAKLNIFDIIIMKRMLLNS
ncbi:MAG: hypothetical protein IJA12_08570 [Oscillospiraceae bacterium]|nr:hypothetical protein [Oscillospiraceae bacterium]